MSQITGSGQHHERDRTAEHRDPCGYQEAQSVPDGCLGAKSYISGEQGCVEKMEYADPELAVGNESFYYRVR